jgi:hypothetical protein
MGSTEQQLSASSFPIVWGSMIWAETFGNSFRMKRNDRESALFEAHRGTITK